MTACATHVEPYQLEAAEAERRPQGAAAPLSVAEVRRALSYIRKSWEDQQLDEGRRPFYLSDTIAHSVRARNQSIEHFSLTFVLAHHTRRLAKPPGETGER